MDEPESSRQKEVNSEIDNQVALDGKDNVVDGKEEGKIDTVSDLNATACGFPKLYQKDNLVSQEAVLQIEKETASAAAVSSTGSLFPELDSISVVASVIQGSSIGLVKSMQLAISNSASADSVISSKTDPNLCFATQAHSNISFFGLGVESSATDHQAWCFSNGSHGRAASIVS
ncbi:Zinc finger protein CONSTANS-LIKE 10 [Camellia lanceoleosa]|uniref:Zinc finger protein CONSTANS-LIKE 10 n=1 Tax=Camellia lanceoleosa TaxID=1840588 RepID=A0ACC0ILG9_9ERIC|nr:Zinc finger protein CONSTANS-LIKE 10 [Camellia lanceoleosa]